MLKIVLFQESGLVIVTTEEGGFSLTKCSNMSDVPTPELGTAIISEEAADLLKKAGEGTLGKSQSKEKINALDTKKEVSDSGIASEQNGHVNSDLAEGKDVHKIDSCVAEAASVVDNNLAEVQVTKTVEVANIDVKDDENENSNTDKVVDSVSESHLEKDQNADLEFKTSAGVTESGIEKDECELRKKDSTGSESDNNEVFYESKSEVSPRDSELVCDLTEREGEKGITDDGDQKEFENIQINVEHVEDDKINEEVKHKNVHACRKMHRKDESENVVVKHKTESLSDNARRFLTSESLISLESDVTYHSESEDLDLFFEDVKEGEVTAYKGTDSDLSEGDENTDVTINMSLDYHIGKADKGGQSMGSEHLDVKEHAALECRLDEKGMSSADGSVDTVLETDNEIAGRGIVSQVQDNEGLQKVVDDSSLECRLRNKEGSSFFVHGSDVLESAAGQESKKTESSSEEKMMFIPDVESVISESNVCTSLPGNDEVFMSLPLAETDRNKSLIKFAKGYVSDIVLKSVDLYNKQLKDEKIMVRKESYTSENIDICIPKRHYSEELVETASEIIPRKLSSGSVEILSPVVHIPSEKKGDLKFFTYKVDTDADVVLTSIEEEKNPLEGMVTIDPMQSPISGFGICYSGSGGNSDLDSDQDGSDDSDSGGIGNLGTGKGQSEMIPEIIAMPITKGDSVDENSKDVTPERETIDIDKEDDSVVSDRKRNVHVGKPVVEIKGRDTKMEEGVGENVEAADDREIECLSGEGGEKKEELKGQIESGESDEVKGNLVESKDETHSEGAAGVDIDHSESSQMSNKEEERGNLSDGGSETGARLSGELSPHLEGTKETGSMSRKKSKKRGSKKHSKDECCLS